MPGTCRGFPIMDALGDLDAVDLAVVYGVATDGAGISVAVAAVTLLEGAELDAELLAAALSALAARGATGPGPGRRPDPGHDLVPAEHRRAARRGDPVGARRLAPRG